MTKDEVIAIVAQVVAQTLAQKPTKAGKQATAGANGRTERQIANEKAAIRAFKKAGFGTVKPHEDVKTFNRWVAEGFRPVDGSKGVKVKGFSLFHRTQVRQITTEEMPSLALKASNVAELHPAQ